MNMDDGVNLLLLDC